MTPVRLPVILSLAVLLTGCVGLPTVFQQRVVKPHVAGSVGVPLPGPSRSPSLSARLTLEQCIEIARTNNPGLAAGSWDVRTAQAQRDTAASQCRPRITTRNSYRSFVQNQRLQPARINAEPGMFSSSVLSMDLVLNMPLFTGGRITNEIRGADLLALAAQNRLARSWEEIVFNITSSFYSILGQRKLLGSLRFSRDVLTRHRRRVMDMFTADKAARVDVLRTEVRIADIDQRIIREQTVLDIQRRVLATLLGASTGNESADIQGELRVRRSLPSVDGALAMAFSERSDYRAARASLDAQGTKVVVARAAQWPTVSVEGSYGVRVAAGIDDNGVAITRRLNWPNFPTIPVERAPLRGPWPNPDSNLPVGSIGVVLDYPIFDGGRISSQIREQEAKLLSAQQLLRKLELQIRLEVETALLNGSSALQRVTATQKAIEQARESLRIERTRYDLGKGTITDVLDAQSAALEAETNYYHALVDYNLAFAQLGLAVGEKR
ncbi:MAG: TolC family protein [Desulfomonilaceae bacterium]|nr:TolC family protein [Desulfomonilaceae bacterium]